MMVLEQQKKKNNKKSINFSKTNTKFCLSLNYNADETQLNANKIVICKFEAKVNIT